MRAGCVGDARAGDERPDAGQGEADQGAHHQAGPVGGIEEGVPELAGFVAGAGDGEPGVSGGEHEGEDAVDDDQRADGGDGVDPADGEVELLGDAVPGVVVDGDAGELDQEEDPLDGPAEDEVVDEGAGGFGLGEADGEPDADAADGAEDSGDEEEEAGVVLQLREPVGAAFAEGFALGHGEEEASANGELGDHDVEDRDDGDDRTAAEPGYFPEWIVHARSPEDALSCRTGPLRVGSVAS